MDLTKKGVTFRITEDTQRKLLALKKQINDNTPIKLSNGDIVEILIRQASADKITKKVNDL